MNILVCIKQILDPEIPARDFRIDPEKKQAVRGPADLVVNIFCENAIETALQFRDRSGGKITALSYGSEQTEDALRKALAMKVDEAVLVTNDVTKDVTNGGDSLPDPLRVARVLAAAVRKLGGFDLILAGRESGDWGMGQTGALLAEELAFPFIGLVDQIETGADQKTLRARRQTDQGYEIVEAAPPLVVSVTNSKGNLPRIPKTRDVMASYRKPLTRWSVEDLGLENQSAAEASCALLDLQLPQRNSHCQFMAGDSLDEKVEAFARRVKEIVNQVS